MGFSLFSFNLFSIIICRSLMGGQMVSQVFISAVVLECATQPQVLLLS